jgi:hypothetical protein
MPMHPRMTAAVILAVIAICGGLWQAVPASQNAGWQVTDLDVGFSELPDIAIDAAGNAVAVWTTRSEPMTADGRVRTATLTAATGSWSPAVTLSNPLDDSSNLRVGSNAAGDAVAVWRADRSSSPLEDYIVVSRYVAATKTWHLAREIPANGHGARAVIDRQGNMTVVWVEFIRAAIGGYCYYYYYPCQPAAYAIRSVRYEAAASSWSSPAFISAEGEQIQSEVGIDGTGNVTVLWTRNGFIESVRWSSGSNSWFAVKQVASFVASPPRMVVDTEGNVIGVWSVFNGVQSARFSAATETWSAPIVVAADNTYIDLDGALGVDAAGNATVVYTARPAGGRPAVLRSIQYLQSTDAWSGVVDIAASPFNGGGGQVAVDSAGNATAVWRPSDRTLQTARRPVGGQWSADPTVGGLTGRPRIAADAAGNVLLLWTRSLPPRTLQAARWSATLGAPTIGRVISSSGALSIDFTPLQVLDSSYAVLNYEYSLDNGATWTARAPASASSPMVVDGLIDGDAYPMRLRAVNVAGPGLPSDTIILTPGLAPPADLRAAVVGSSVTFAWTPPSTSVVPTGYVLEGGLSPGSVQARLHSPGTGTIFTLPAPVGVFYVRVRASIGLAESEPSPEIQVNVGVDGPPSPPIGLLGLADGDFLALAWQNTFAGGAPSGMVLDVSGDRSEHRQLPPLTDQFSFSGVPPGTYTFALRAFNDSGESSPSNAVTLTFPGTCSPPTTPANFSASNSGNTIVLRWSPPASGAAPTRYVLSVTGPTAGEFSVTGLAVSGAVGQGTYTISVASANSCGTSVPTPTKTITIP